MSKRRVVINMASGTYIVGQNRMFESLRKTGWDLAHVMRWNKDLPPGSPPHSQIPYGFKMWAFKAALDNGYTSILWLDAAAWATRPLGPFFDEIESVGHFFFHGGAKLGQRCTDSALAAFGCSRDDAMQIALIGGTVYGLDMTHERTAAFYKKWWEYYHAGHFLGPAINTIAENEMRGLAGRPVGFCSNDPRCQGHCHDESCATWAAHCLGMESTGIGIGFGTTGQLDDSRVFVTSQGL